MAHKNQFQLLASRRFLPFFLTQFLGAFNDNVFKSALMVMIAFRLAADQANALNNLAAGLFILPFFLFSATAGQLADKYDKSLLIRRIKLAEIGISLVGVVALVSGSNSLSLLVLFLLGLQSAFFGPIKYAILPQHLRKSELVGGNALVEMGTFVAILGGTIVGTILSGASNGGNEWGSSWIGGLIIAIALAGYLVCRAIPKAAPPVPELQIDLNPIRQTARMLREAAKTPAIFYSIIGISWFWLLGAAYLTQIPSFGKNVLGGNEPLVALLLCSFTVGVAIGSLTCERLSGGRIELGLVPLGAAGLTYGGIALSVIGGNLTPLTEVSLAAFWNSPGAQSFLLHLALIGIFGGLYIVPLYAMIQDRTDKALRARVIAVTNIMNALFMVISAILGLIFLTLLDFTIPQFFMVIALMNAAVAVFVFNRVPEFAMRLLIWLLSHTMYRVKHQGLEQIPEEGPAIIVCNHVSYVDALLLAGAVRRPIRFIMYKPIYEIPVLHFIFKTGRAIPICSKQKDPEGYEKAFVEIEQGLKNGDLLCIFPEGQLTKDGELGPFKAGIEKILRRTPVPVIPMALRGLWGSFFSHKDGHAFTTLPRRFWSKVSVVAGKPLDAAAARAETLREQVLGLRGEQR
ncbi:MFS transporter [Microbulbifer thermotolerans]|uniref:MFS transporter n=1 Tax=Microbulbifer thermotolerans TaxID=252514 RepID=UPI0008EFF1CD|nr:MFS transporter [Microbulbifer thermotolerans]MCX2779436.1 MFS transporter [Microbulbifer thermotolerans]MCX2784052.1 MFS transporter [Microbulbifer thermotolerans]MCX2806119.1 MFS transporter [Microbulbifer thermotolerans]MCX2842627.1 MFS transporter [Microbulbifer thermotolerans]SFC81790.1 1-acyl-sn-glycerol-3-phosphate acyltransferases [Microbulbifer thermotolerans]